MSTTHGLAPTDVRGSRKLRPLPERFWSKVDRNGPNGCWDWKGGVGGPGAHKYGVLLMSSERIGPGQYNRRFAKAHRVSYEMHVGPISAGLHVCHKCDRPICVNPAHLFLGTQRENMADMTQKHRRARGMAHGQARLTESVVLAIRAAEGTYRTIGERFGVNASVVCEIKSGKAWGHVQANNAGPEN